MRTFYSPGWQLLEMTGPDAQDFLNRLTTVDTRNLSPGAGRPGFFLNPQGKVEAVFHLWRFSAEQFFFELDPGQQGTWKSKLLEVIDRYTFAEKMELKTELNLKSVWIILDSEAESSKLEQLGLGGLSAGQCRQSEEKLLILHHGTREFGRDWISLWGPAEQLRKWSERHSIPIESGADSTQLNRWRVEQAHPALDHELTANTIPLELGMTDAIAENKGCYPGQEVIERIISIGSPAKRLVQLTRDDTDNQAPISEKSKLLSEADPSVQIGEITSVAGDLALALVKKLHAKEGTRAKVEPGGAILRVLRVK